MELVGRRIRNIEVKELVGKGGMGWVYLGFDHALHRQVALKAIRPAAGLTEENKARFVREARVLSQLEHVNICRIYDFLEHNGSEILVLEFVEGKSLSEALEEGLTDRQRLSIARQLTSALIAAHGAGIVHRDLKPENVMWVSEGRGADGLVKVLDFGLARSLGSEAGGLAADSLENGRPLANFEDLPTDVAGQPEDGIAAGGAIKTSPPRRAVIRPPLGNNPEVTRFGRVMGTISYMSPEQARGETLTTASDMFTLGLLFHEIFADRPAYDPDLPTMEKLELASLAQIRPIQGIDPALVALIRRLESPLPDNRPRAVDVLNSLDRISERPKRRLRLILAAVLILAVAGIGIKYAWDLKRGQELTENALERARAAQASEKQVTDFLVDVFKLADPNQSQGSEVTVEELLARGAEKIETELKDQPEIQARLLQTLGSVHSNWGKHRAAMALLQRSVDILREQDRNPLMLAVALDRLAVEQQRLGSDQEAAACLAESLMIRRRRLPAAHPDLAVSLARFGELRYRERALDEARELLQESLDILARPEPRLSSSGREQWARSALLLGCVWDELGDPVQAETLFRQAGRELEDVLGEDAPDVADTFEILGRFLAARKRVAEAKPILQRALEIRQKVLPPSDQRIEALSLYLSTLDGSLPEGV